MLALLSACAVTPEPFTAQELATQASADRAAMFKGGEPLTGPLSVAEAIARALKYNLDKRAKMMEEALALGQTDVDRWDLLPKLAANAGYTSRSEPNATRSRDLYSQTTTSANPTYSADRDNYTADLGLSWNILDFGVSYFTAHQNADRALIAAERKRKATHNLVAEVRFAFWRAAAHQTLKSEVDRAVAEARDALATARTVERENLKAPAEALRYQKSLLETLRQLTAIQQELSTAPIELAALINLPPGTPLTLAVPARMELPEWTLPLERMEELAFAGNADLREQGYLSRIAVDDTKKAMVKLLPGITFTASRNYDHNSFLIDNHWYEAGAKLSWNLMNLLSGPDAIRYAETNEEVVKARRVALRMAVLAQVHVSERQFRNAVSQYEQSDELWLVDKRLFELSEAKAANDASGVLEKVASRASAIASQLRRFQTYAQVEQSYAKIQATLGRDVVPETVAATDIKTLSAAISGQLDSWGRGEPGMSAKAPEEKKDAAAGSEPLFARLARWVQRAGKELLPTAAAEPASAVPAKAAVPNPAGGGTGAAAHPGSDPQSEVPEAMIRRVKEFTHVYGRANTPQYVADAEPAPSSRR